MGLFGWSLPEALSSTIRTQPLPPILPGICRVEIRQIKSPRDRDLTARDLSAALGIPSGTGIQPTQTVRVVEARVDGRYLIIDMVSVD